MSPDIDDFFSDTAVLEPKPVDPVLGLDTGQRGPTLDHAALYGLAGDIVRMIEPHTEANTAALLFQLFTVFGNVIGRGPFHAVEGDKHHVNLFIALVGETSKGRKGTSWGRIRQVFTLAAPDWLENCLVYGLSSGEGLINEVRDDRETESAINDKRRLVIESEFASVLRVVKREGNTLSAVVRNAWDSGELRTLTRNDPLKATGAHISIIGHVTRDELLRYLTETETANGFANRFLWVFVKRSKCLPEGGSLKDSDLDRLKKRLSTVIEFGKNAGNISRDEEARQVWRSVYPDLSEGKPGLLGAVTGRAEAQVSRLAVIYATLDCSSVVKRPHIEAALAVWEYAEASAAYIFGVSLGNRVADTILTALRRAPNGKTRTEISGLFGRNKNAKEISRALSLLCERRFAKSEIEDTDGRSTERWRATN